MNLLLVFIFIQLCFGDEVATVPKINEVNTATTNVDDNKPKIYNNTVNLVRNNNMNHQINDSGGPLTSGFYVFVLLSIMAIAFFIYRSYSLRFSRAERKYGVVGQRSTQELTPLPLALEDDYSENEDQTLFEIQRNATLVA